MSYVVLDLETVPNEELFDLVPMPDPDARMKDVEKIRKDIEKKRIKQLDKLGLDKAFGKIVCGGLKFSYEEKAKIFIGDERDIIGNINEIIDLPKNLLITSNGTFFDLPFLQFRCIFHKMKSPFSSEHFKKYSQNFHFDIQQVLANYSSQGIIKTSIISKVLGIPIKDDIDGSMTYDLWKEGNIEKIAEHCEDDVLSEEQQYLRISPYYNQLEA